MRRADLDGPVFDFDPNSVGVHRQQGAIGAIGVGGPRGPRLEAAVGRALGGELGRAGARRDQVEAAKPAKLLTRAEIARNFSRLARAFQHDPSNMFDRARREWPETAISAAPGRQLPDPRDRGPKLSPRIHTRELQIAISSPYFIPRRRKPVRKAADRLSLFPRSHLPRRWKQARKQRKPLI